MIFSFFLITHAHTHLEFMPIFSSARLKVSFVRLLSVPFRVLRMLKVEDEIITCNPSFCALKYAAREWSRKMVYKHAQ